MCATDAQTGAAAVILMVGASHLGDEGPGGPQCDGVWLGHSLGWCHMCGWCRQPYYLPRKPRLGTTPVPHPHLQGLLPLVLLPGVGG